MTKLMDKAIEAVSKLPEDRQDALAEALLNLADRSVYELSAAEREAVEEGLADVEAGRVIGEEEITALFTRFRLA